MTDYYNRLILRDHSQCVVCYADDTVEKPKKAYYDPIRHIQYATCKRHMKKLRLGLYKQHIEQNGEDYSKW